MLCVDYLFHAFHDAELDGLAERETRHLRVCPSYISILPLSQKIAVLLQEQSINKNENKSEVAQAPLAIVCFSLLESRVPHFLWLINFKLRT